MSRLQPSQVPSSPPWTRNTKLFIVAACLVFIVALLLTFGQIFTFIIMATLVALVLRPVVDYLDVRTPRIPRWLDTLFVYLLIVGALLAIPISTIPSIVNQVIAFFNFLPALLRQLVSSVTLLLSEPIIIFGGEYYIPVDELSLSQLQQSLLDLISSTAQAVPTIAGNLAFGTLGFLSRFVLVLFLAYYITKDGHQLTAAIRQKAPPGYVEDISFLLHRIGLIWGAFLRGQVILMVTIAVVVFVVASILGLPNPVALGVIAGVMEIVPYVGPVIAAIPAALLAVFQSDASWLGSLTSPFWFTLIVLFAYWLVQQFENYLLLPRVMGHQLKLHPAVVFVGAIGGWQLAGVLGVFVAAPTIATLRLFGSYVYCKLTNQPLTLLLGDAAPDVETDESEQSGSDDAPIEAAPEAQPESERRIPEPMV